MEISEDKTKMRRSPNKPLPEVTDEYKNDVKNRYVHIKGFPTDATLDDIKEWLEENQDGGIGRHTALPHTTRTDRKSNSKEV